MSYLNQAQDPRSRATAIAGVVAIHAGLGLAVVTGLTIAGVEITTPKPFGAVTFTNPPPPPPPKPTDPVTKQAQKPVAPLPPFTLPPTPGPTVDTFDPTVDTPAYVPPTFDPGPVALPPRPSPGLAPVRARPVGSPSAWISTDDYPRRPLVDEVEGSAGYRLIVGSNGRVASCEITASSGNEQLDATTCRLLTRRARFDAATDGSGARVVGSYTGSVRWEIPD